MSAAVCPTPRCRARQGEFFAVDLYVRVAANLRSSRGLLAEEVLDDHVAAFHADLHREVSVVDFHLVLPPLGRAVKHVVHVALEGTDGRLRLRVVCVGFDDDRVAVDRTTMSGTRADV